MDLKDRAQLAASFGATFAGHQHGSTEWYDAYDKIYKRYIKENSPPEKVEKMYPESDVEKICGDAFYYGAEMQRIGKAHIEEFDEWWGEKSSELEPERMYTKDEMELAFRATFGTGMYGFDEFLKKLDEE